MTARRILLLAIILLGITTLCPLPTQADTGAAATYAAGYGDGWFCSTMWLHVSWGDAIAGATCDPSGYWCVRPGLLPGDRLLLSANGTTISCTIGDTVEPYDVENWWASWVVELNWDAFTVLGLDRHNVVEVSGLADTPSPPAGPRSITFDTTGYAVADPFLAYWEDNGGLAAFGYPETEAYADAATGLTMQYFERARFELHGDQIMLGRVGAEQVGK